MKNLSRGLLAGAAGLTLGMCASIGIAQQEAVPSPPPPPEFVDPIAALKNDDGSWKYTNQLVDSPFPGLQEYAHLPVDFMAWGPDVLARAVELDKPIFLTTTMPLSRWSTQQIEQVFADPEIAEKLNESFVCALTDRALHPALDRTLVAYMEIAERSPGWPLSAFLTTEGKPFFAVAAFGVGPDMKPRTLQLINGLSQGWVNEWDAIVQTSEAALSEIDRVLRGQFNEETRPDLSPKIADDLIGQLEFGIDRVNGGWGSQPKVPSPLNHLFVLQAARFRERPDLASHTFTTLEAISKGAVIDQIGGGIHRYSNEASWRLPEAEKTLFDQGLMLEVFAEAQHISPSYLQERAMRLIADYALNRLMLESGLFAAGETAESTEGEAAHVLWTRDEIRSILGPEDSEVFLLVFDLFNPGIEMGDDVPGVVYQKQDVAPVAERLSWTNEQLISELARVLERIRLDAAERPSPFLDTTVVTAWNGYMITALAKAGAVLEEPRYIEAAQRAADAILTTEDGSIPRVVSPKRIEPGTSEDYASMARAALALHGATGEKRWLDTAISIIDQTDELFLDKEHGGYFLTTESAEVPVRMKSSQDRMTPSANSMLVNAMLDLAELTDDEAYAERAKETLSVYSRTMSEQSRGSVNLIRGLDRYFARTGGASHDEFTLSSDVVAVEASLSADEVAAGSSFRVLLRLNVEDGWYIGASPALGQTIVPVAGGLRSRLPIQIVDVTYPTGDELTLEGFEEPMSLNSGEIPVIIHAVLGEDAPVGSESSLVVATRFQACQPNRLLALEERAVGLPFKVAAPINPTASAAPDVPEADPAGQPADQ